MAQDSDELPDIDINPELLIDTQQKRSSSSYWIYLKMWMMIWMKVWRGTCQGIYHPHIPKEAISIS